MTNKKEEKEEKHIKKSVEKEKLVEKLAEKENAEKKELGTVKIVSLYYLTMIII